MKKSKLKEQKSAHLEPSEKETNTHYPYIVCFDDYGFDRAVKTYKESVQRINEFISTYTDLFCRDISEYDFYRLKTGDVSLLKLSFSGYVSEVADKIVNKRQRDEVFNKMSADVRAFLRDISSYFEYTGFRHLNVNGFSAHKIRFENGLAVFDTSDSNALFLEKFGMDLGLPEYDELNRHFEILSAAYRNFRDFLNKNKDVLNIDPSKQSIIGDAGIVYRDRSEDCLKLNVRNLFYNRG